MEESVCRVTLGNLTKEYKKGTTYSESSSLIMNIRSSWQWSMVIIFGSYGRQLKRIARFIFLQRQILLEMTHIEEVCVSFSLKHSMIFPGMI